MPEMANVKLDVYDNKRNSLTSIANAMNAPPVIFVANIRYSGDTESTVLSDNFNSASPI